MVPPPVAEDCPDVEDRGAIVPAIIGVCWVAREAAEAIPVMATAARIATATAAIPFAGHTRSLRTLDTELEVDWG